jgi:hypothetical protein
MVYLLCVAYYNSETDGQAHLLVESLTRPTAIISSHAATSAGPSMTETSVGSVSWAILTRYAIAACHLLAEQCAGSLIQTPVPGIMDLVI